MFKHLNVCLLTVLTTVFLTSANPAGAQDCNGNTIADSNDIAGGTSTDCNTNGVPDECDISDGYSNDCASNGTPDECETGWLVASDPTAGAGFGRSVALHGDVAIIGSPDAPNVGFAPGAAYIYRFQKGKWVFEARLQNPSLSTVPFGSTVAIHNDTAVVEARMGGYFHIYQYNAPSWSHVGSFATFDICAMPGLPISIDDQWIAVATCDDSDFLVSLYQRQDATWVRTDGLFLGPYFGHGGVSLSGDRLLVSVTSSVSLPYCLEGAGAAFVYQHTDAGWVLESELEPPIRSQWMPFGGAVALDGNLAVVAGPNGYCTYRKRDDSWVLESELRPSNLGHSLPLGGPVALFGDYLVVGGGAAAYVFQFDNNAWIEINKLTTPPSVVAVGSHGILIGAPSAGGIVPNTGAVYFAGLDLSDCDGSGIDDACEIASGSSPDRDANGMPDACDLAQGRLDDCNGNQVPDQYDLVAGTSKDCNANNVPDTCDCDTNGIRQTPIYPSGDDCNEYFGYSVAVEGNTAVIQDGYSLHVLRRLESGWSREAILPENGSFDIDENVLVVGRAYDDDVADNAGAVCIYRFNGTDWVQEIKILPPDGMPNGNFGQNVAIQGNRIVVMTRAYVDSEGVRSAAYAYRFDGASWEQTNRFTFPEDYRDGVTAVNVTDNNVLVGDLSTEIVRLYHCEDNGCLMAQVFTAPEPVWGFGNTIAMDGDLIVIAPQGFWEEVVSAYVYRRINDYWYYEDKLSVAGTGGCSTLVALAISQQVVLMGFANDQCGELGGSVHRFSRNGWGWKYSGNLSAEYNTQGSHFGWAVGLDNSTAIVGDFSASITYRDAGMAYAFEFLSADCNENQVPDECESDLDGDGVPDECDGDTDGDGVDEDGDGSGVVGDHSCNGLNFPTCDDNCRGVTNPDQSDADSDGIGDACDKCVLADPGQEDCQSNGVGDVCDIAGGTSEDCGSDGVPDECGNCADLDSDGDVDDADYQLFRLSFGHAVGDLLYTSCADYDHSGAVGLLDFSQWLDCRRDYMGDEPLDWQEFVICLSASGPEELLVLTECARNFDVDADDDVDLFDYAVISQMLP